MIHCERIVSCGQAFLDNKLNRCFAGSEVSYQGCYRHEEQPSDHKVPLSGVNSPQRCVAACTASRYSYAGLQVIIIIIIIIIIIFDNGERYLLIIVYSLIG